MAQQLGLRAFNQYTVQRKLQGDQMRGLERRYSEYLHLLACDTEVGGLGVQGAGHMPSLSLLGRDSPRGVQSSVP